MKLTIFIGHFKTGSTSIQSFLSSNYLRLLRAGILYPSIESQGLARNLRVVMSGKDIPTPGHSLNIIEPHNALALRLLNEETGHGMPPYYSRPPSGFQMFEMIQNQIAELQPHSLIICSEVLSLLGLTEKREAISRLSARFSNHDVTIYCNLRRPDEYLSSWHRQRLKFGAKLERLSDNALDEYLEGAHFQQSKLIEGWINDHFPDANLVVRNFEDVKSSGGAVKDFIAESGIIYPDDVEFPEDQNPSVPCAFADIGRKGILELPREDSKSLVNWLASKKARKLVSHPADHEVEMFGSENRQLLLEKFLPIAKRLSEITETTPFYHDIEDIGRCRPVSEAEAVKSVHSGLVRAAALSGLPTPVREWLKNWTY